MPTYTSNSITITDSLDNVNLELFISSNIPETQVLSNGVCSPSWKTTPLVLTPTVYVRNKLVTNPTITWERRSGGQGYNRDFISGESISNNILTINKDLLVNDVNRIISYKCTVTYGEITHSVEKSFSLNVIGSDGKDGSSVSIKGAAYTTEKSYTVGSLYTLYSDVTLTNQIESPTVGDSYLVGGHLFVYSGDEDFKFTCVGSIKGVSIERITGPVTNGLIDTYTIHYSDGQTSTYEIKNGSSPKILNLHASKYTVAYNANGQLKDTSDIILTANQQNFSSVVTWTTSDGAILSGVGNVRTLSPLSFNNQNSIQISISSGELSDTVTIVKVQDGLVGEKGQSSFITYNDNIETPDAPTGNGASNGWHTNMTNTSVWMSQKTAQDIASGTWGQPVKIKGTDGRGISNTVITYQLSDSGATVPTGAWLPNLPAVIAGKYLWTKTVTGFTDGTSVTGYNIGRSGVDGAAGRGIKVTNVTYLAGTSGTVVPTGTWSANIPEVSPNQYLWTRTVILYTDDSTTTSYSIGRMGASGVDGYTVVLTNDTHVFAGSTSAALAGSAKCEIIAYKGATRVAATIGTISGVPTGMTATINDNGTISASFTVNVTTSMNTRNGVLIVPVTIDGRTFNKSFSYSIAFQGATGISSVLFKIYSDSGFIFHNENDITLKLQKMYGSSNIALSGNNKVQWSKLVNGVWTNTWKYDSGDTANVAATGETLIVKPNEINGTQLYRCVLTYNGQTYTDVVTITDKTDTYQSKIIALGGNILHGGETGLIAYASLFHGADEEDALLCPIYSDGITPVANQIYYILDGTNIVTKKYAGGTWVNDATIKQEHLYSWFILDKNTGQQQSIGSGKVIYITNEMIANSGIVQCKIGDFSVSTETFSDANDPIVSAQEPDVTTPGQLWFNTDDGILYAYRTSSASWEPVNSGQNRTYISAPITMMDCCYYKKGDLWVVSDSDSSYTNERPGTLLIAINDLRDGADGWSAATWKARLAGDWDNKLYYDDAINQISDYQERLSAYMNFEVDGLKIGATNTEFYTKVTPYDLGFYQGPEKVAYVSNKKMYNTSLEVTNDVQIISHKSDSQLDPPKPFLNLGNYKFIIEENNSLSIAYTLISAPIPSVSRYGLFNSYMNLFFEPWSTQNSYGYVSSHNTTEKDNIVVKDMDGNIIPTTVATGRGYLQVKATSFPDTVVVQIPARSVYNKGVSNNTLGYDTVESPNDAITLTLTKT